MKILILTNKVPYPPKDGGSIATFSLAKNLSELDNQVTILTLNTSKHYFDLKNIPSEITEKMPIYGIDINTDITLKDAAINLFFSKLPYNAIRFRNKDFDNKLKEILKKEEFDIIQLEGLYMCFYVETIRLNSKAKIAYRAHNIEYEIWDRTLANQQNKIKKLYLKILRNRIKRMETLFVNKYDFLVPITSRDEKKLNDMGNNKPSHVSPTGINKTSFSNVSNPEFPSVFHIGALDWAPNQEGLLWFLENCWKELYKKNNDLVFYIAGRNAPKWFVEKITQPGVKYLGEINDAYDFMSSKAIMIVPLLSGSGMRIKIIEGMSLGKTIVSTSVGTEGIDSTNKKNILIADNPSDFIQNIQNCLLNREFFDEIGKNAITFVEENYNNRKIASSLLAFYNKNL